MTVKEFMRNFRCVTRYPKDLVPSNEDNIVAIKRPWVVCNDGFEISVQASKSYYCSPRENLLDQDYDEVELGFPSAEDSLIINYAEDPSIPTRTVYGWVPMDVVEKLVDKHGGIKEAKPEAIKWMKENRDIYTECSW